jgi:HPt (histidine-containing phosphotransfer) domain-containing protein
MNSFGLDETTVDMLLESFFSTINGDIKNIQDAIDTKNAKEIASSSHYLKGACANLAMNPAFEILQEINLKAKNGETDFDLSLLKNYFEQIKIN